MRDNYTVPNSPVGGPATKAVAVVPHDVNELTNIPKALYVGGAGDITMRGVDDASDTVWKGVGAGQIIPFRPKLIKTATTATFILALY